MWKYEPAPTDDRRIWDLWLTHTYQAAIVVADQECVFEALDRESGTVSETAERLNFDYRATGVLLRLLASLGLLSLRDAAFQLTDEARTYFLKSSPFYWGPMMAVGVNEWHVTTLTAALRKKDSADATGPEGAPVSFGTGRASDGWAEGKISLEQARGIASRMHSHSVGAAIGAVRAYDFAGIRRILDVGGGSGCFMVALAQANPDIHCTVMDLPAMCAVAQEYIEAGGVHDRVDTIGVDMFREPWPKSFDAVFFSNIWHDWNFRTCSWLARRSYEILPAGGRIMLHEMLLDDDGAGPATAAAFSMLMLLATQGQQFTFGELKDIIQRAGFSRVETQNTHGYYGITTGWK